jgi:hypothetical protein
MQAAPFATVPQPLQPHRQQQQQQYQQHFRHPQASASAAAAAPAFAATGPGSFAVPSSHGSSSYSGTHPGSFFGDSGLLLALAHELGNPGLL